MDGHNSPFYRLSGSEVLTAVRSSEEGLTKTEASDRLRHVGPNQLERIKHTSTWWILLRQPKNLLVITLLVSAATSLYLHDEKTATILIFIALMNVVVGFFQEYKTGGLSNILERSIVPQAKVVRHGKAQQISSSELVPGDVIYVEAGNSIPADARVLQEDELATNDFALTGKREPTRKFVHAMSGDAPVSSRHNMLFMGTTVALGSGRAVVVGTGMHTELGRIASSNTTAHPGDSPLQHEMNSLGIRLTQATLLLVAALALFELRTNLGLKTSLLFGISVAAAMIPNGLVAEVSITLAQTANRMPRTKALVKRLSAVATLGTTSVIVADKTGILTKNEMTVTRTLIGRTEYTVTGTGYEMNGAICDSKGKPISGQQLKDLHLFFETGALASNATVNQPDKEHSAWYVVGDPTEGALITLARKAGLEPTELNDLFPEHKEYAFDSARKRMSSIRDVDAKLYLFVKGDPKSILEQSVDIWDHGHARPLTKADRDFLSTYNETHTALAERNLAFAYRVLPKGFNPSTQSVDDAEQKLTFLGVASMVDPLREQVPGAIEASQAAHIRISVITGDFSAAAKAVAQKIGLNKDNATIVTGEDLTNLPDSQVLDLLLQGGAVFSRVSPEDKLRITELARSSGDIVAVTGGSINDVPALECADIGVALGQIGANAATGAAEIVLLDDSFATLVKAIDQGRVAFQNVRKAARCVMIDNVGELFIVLISLVATGIWGIPVGITAIQILAIDLVAQIFPVTALGWDSVPVHVMHEKPRDLREHILNRKSVYEFIGFGGVAAVLSYANYLFYFYRHHISAEHLATSSSPYMQASVLTYVTLVLCQFISLLIVRSQGQALFSKYLWSNKKLLAAFVISLFCILNIVYNPVFRSYFGSASLSIQDWLTAFATAILYTGLCLFYLDTRSNSRKELIRRHGTAKVRAHLRPTVTG
jgi:Ca2+-transporting ATPase